MSPEMGSDQDKDKTTNFKDETVTFSSHPSFDFGVLLSWLVALCAILITIFFWWLNKDLGVTISEKESEKTQIITEITNKNNTELERKAQGFKSSVMALKKAKAEKFNMSKFASDLNTRITNDVILTSLSVGADGSLSLSGETATYRFTGDLMMALKSWDVISEVDLKSVSIQQKDDDSKVVVFSITAQVDKTKFMEKIAPTSETSTSTQDSSATSTETSTSTNSSTSTPTPTITPTDTGTSTSSDENATQSTPSEIVNPFGTDSMSYRGGNNEKV